MFLRSAFLATVVFAYGTLATDEPQVPPEILIAAEPTAAAPATPAEQPFIFANITPPKEHKPIIGNVKPPVFGKVAPVKAQAAGLFVAPKREDPYHSYLTKEEKEELQKIFANHEQTEEERAKALAEFEDDLSEEAKAQFKKNLEFLEKKKAERKEKESKLSDDAKAALKVFRESQATFRKSLAALSEEEKKAIAHITAPFLKKAPIEKKEDELSADAAQIVKLFQKLNREERQKVQYVLRFKNFGLGKPKPSATKPEVKVSHPSFKDQGEPVQKVTRPNKEVGLPHKDVPAPKVSHPEHKEVAHKGTAAPTPAA